MVWVFKLPHLFCIYRCQVRIATWRREETSLCGCVPCRSMAFHLILHGTFPVSSSPFTVRVPHLCTPEQLYSSIANHHDDLAITGNTLDERNWVLCENKCGPTKRASLRIDLGGGDPLVLDKVFLAARLARIGSSLNFADQPENWIKLKKRQKPSATAGYPRLAAPGARDCAVRRVKQN